MKLPLNDEQNTLLKQIEKEGFVVVEDLLDNKTCQEFKNLLNRFYDDLHPHYATTKKKSLHGLNDKAQEKIVFNLHNKHINFMRLINHSVTMPVIGAILQKGSYNDNEPYIYTGSSGRSPSFNSEQQLHIDSRVPGCNLALQAQCLWLLDDFTQQNGATRVVPLSHQFKFYPENGKHYPKEVTVTAPAGSVIIFNGGLWHGSSKKCTHDDRWGVIISYARWFYKQSFQILQNTPKYIYDRLNEFEKCLLGAKTQLALDEFERISMRSETVQDPQKFYTKLESLCEIM
ncbi:MAG: hypothetical protein ACD_60C00009G0008 [uncultured bacterium]|nr:MAG: hypothetical protein ACD_60C00009G0008 [uncultured bacterium]